MTIEERAVDALARMMAWGEVLGRIVRPVEVAMKAVGISDAVSKTEFGRRRLDLRHPYERGRSPAQIRMGMPVGRVTQADLATLDRILRPCRARQNTVQQFGRSMPDVILDSQDGGDVCAKVMSVLGNDGGDEIVVVLRRVNGVGQANLL